MIYIEFSAELGAHFHSGKFSAGREFCKILLACTNFRSEKNFEVENFQLLTMIFSENFLSVEIFLERKWALKFHVDWYILCQAYRPFS
jgi:hypothetical protein